MDPVWLASIAIALKRDWRAELQHAFITEDRTEFAAMSKHLLCTSYGTWLKLNLQVLET